MMGRGLSHGAATVVNAMPCGIGATIGVALETSASFRAVGGERIVRIANDPGEDDGMARLCVEAAFAAAGLEEPEGWVLEIDSEIPISRGLKSSSSACNAIIESALSAAGFEMDRVDMVRLGVGCARRAGVTVTGAFDDACGCAFGGFVMTDNRRDEIMVQTDVEDMDVVIHVPDRKIPKGSLPLERLRALAPESERIAAMAARDPYGAMTANGRLIAAASGLDNSVAEAALRLGAVGAGITGSGPATAIVLEKGDSERFLSESGLEGVILTSTRGRAP
jgi:shikimate kinase